MLVELLDADNHTIGRRKEQASFSGRRALWVAVEQSGGGGERERYRREARPQAQHQASQPQPQADHRGRFGVEAGKVCFALGRGVLLWHASSRALFRWAGGERVKTAVRYSANFRSLARSRHHKGFRHADSEIWAA